MSVSSKARVLVPHCCSLFLLFALVSTLISLVFPAAAWADVYTWTDAKGKTVFSDVLPKQGEKVQNFEVVTKETRPAPQATPQVPTPTEQALLERIQTLERQQQVQQFLASIPVFPPPSPPPSSYYPDYVPSYTPSYAPTYYPSYYPTYTYPVVRSYAYAAYPVGRFISRPVFAAPHAGVFLGGGSFHGGGHRGGGHSVGGHSGGGHGGRR